MSLFVKRLSRRFGGLLFQSLFFNLLLCRRSKITFTGVSPLAHEIVGQTEVAERISFCVGDFFSDPLPPVGLYWFSRIVHDWLSEKIEVLLKKFFASLPRAVASH